MRRRRKDTAPAQVAEPVSAPQAGQGPFDFDELGLDDGTELGYSALDLGGILLPAPPDGFEVHVQADEESGHINGLLVMGPDSGLEVAAVARGRNSSAWVERRIALTHEVSNAGGKVEAAEGELGDELSCEVPMKGPDGQVVQSSLRFIGFEGPRWLLVGTLHGRAAVDPGAAAELRTMFRSVVVRRGPGAMIQGEPIPLHLPTGSE